MKNLENITLLPLTIFVLLYCSSCSYKCNGTWTQRKSFDNKWKRAQKVVLNPKKKIDRSKSKSVRIFKKEKCAFTSN